MRNSSMCASYLEKRRDYFRQCLAPTIQKVAERFKIAPEKLSSITLVFDSFKDFRAHPDVMYVPQLSTAIHISFLSQVLLMKMQMPGLLIVN